MPILWISMAFPPPGVSTLQSSHLAVYATKLLTPGFLPNLQAKSVLQYQVTLLLLPPVLEEEEADGEASGAGANSLLLSTCRLCALPFKWRSIGCGKNRIKKINLSAYFPHLLPGAVDLAHAAVEGPVSHELHHRLLLALIADALRKRELIKQQRIRARNVCHLSSA